MTNTISRSAHAPLFRSFLAWSLVLGACTPPSAPIDDDSAVPTTDAEPARDASTTLDAGIDASEANDAGDADASLSPDAGASDAGVSDAGASDTGASDAGVGTEFTRPTGAAEVCIGAGCFVVPPSGDWHFNDLIAVGEGIYWIVGARGIAFLESGRFTYLDPLAPHALTAIDGTPRDLWAVGAQGTALHFDGERWTRVATGVSSDLADVWVAADGHAYAVGQGATALEYTAGAWHPMALGLSGTPYLYSVSGWSDELWIAGADRTVLHRAGSSFVALDRESLRCDRRVGYESHDYHAVFASGAGEAFVSGTSLGTAPHGVLARVLGDVLTCSEQPMFHTLDGRGPTDVWGAGIGRAAHWDGFDWTPQTLPATGAITSIGAHRAAAVLGIDYAHVGETDGTTVTPIGDDYHHALGDDIAANTLHETLGSLAVSPSGVAYFQDQIRSTLVRRDATGVWLDLHAAARAKARVLDDEHAWWFDGNGNVGSADAHGTTSLAFGSVSDVLAQTSARALVATALGGAQDLSSGVVTPLGDHRLVEHLLVAGSDVLGTSTTSGSFPVTNVYRLTAGSWTLTTLPGCNGEAYVRGAESWGFSQNGCIVHYHPDGTAMVLGTEITSGTFMPIRALVGTPGSEIVYAIRDGVLSRLRDGAWQPLGLRGGIDYTSILYVAADDTHLWFATADAILRARLDAL